MREVYHGSKNRGIKRLEPHNSTHGNYVYATIYKELAIIFSSRCGDDCVHALFRNNDNEPWQIVERIPEAFNTMFSNSSSIYTLSDSTFKDIKTGFAEVVSEVGVDVISEEFIPNVYDSIKKLANEGKIKLFMYPNKPKDIPQDSSDLIDREIRYSSHLTKKSFERIILLHPYLIEKVNARMASLNLNAEPYKKEDLIDLFDWAVIMQVVFPDREQYLKSIVISISNVYPELVPYLNSSLEFLDKSKEEKISYLIDNLSNRFQCSEELSEQMRIKFLNDTRDFSEIAKDLYRFVNNSIIENSIEGKVGNSFKQ